MADRKNEPTAKNEAERNREALDRQMTRYVEKGIPNPSGSAETGDVADTAAAPTDERIEIVNHEPAPVPAARKAKDGEA